MDSGELDLDKVFELIAEGENLAVHFEKELKVAKKFLVHEIGSKS